jgi:hypothetical protein
MLQEFWMLTGLGRKLFGRWYPSRGPQVERGPQSADYVEGACLLVRREAYQQVGGLDEGYFMYAEEVDWCYAFKKAGWEVWYQPQAVVIHHGGASSVGRRTAREGDLYRSRVRFFRKHYGPPAAWMLKTQILALTALKGAAHRLLRLLTHGARGRQVISLGELAKKLEGV